MQKRLAIAVVIVVSFLGADFAMLTALRAQQQQQNKGDAMTGSPHSVNPVNQSKTTGQAPKMTLGYFDAVDPRSGMKAHILLPAPIDQWAIENPWRFADRSLLKEPGVYVIANFQDHANTSFFGLVRTMPDSAGYDCARVYTKLAEADGLKLMRFNESVVDAEKGVRSFVFEYFGKERDIIVGSKVLCDTKSGIEVFVVAPNQEKFGPLLNQVLELAALELPSR